MSILFLGYDSLDIFCRSQACSFLGGAEMAAAYCMGHTYVILENHKIYCNI